jgi:hypothetical protein
MYMTFFIFLQNTGLPCLKLVCDAMKNRKLKMCNKYDFTGKKYVLQQVSYFPSQVENTEQIDKFKLIKRLV